MCKMCIVNWICANLIAALINIQKSSLNNYSVKQNAKASTEILLIKKIDLCPTYTQA